MGSIVGCSGCRGYSRGEYIGSGGIERGREGSRSTEIGMKISPRGWDRGRKRYYGIRSLEAWEGRGYENDKALQPECLGRLRGGVKCLSQIL